MQSPTKLPLRLEDMRRARDQNDVRAFMTAVIRSFEELDRAWPQLVADIQQAEVLP